MCAAVCHNAFSTFQWSCSYCSVYSQQNLNSSLPIFHSFIFFFLTWFVVSFLLPSTIFCLLKKKRSIQDRYLWHLCWHITITIFWQIRLSLFEAFHFPFVPLNLCIISVLIKYDTTPFSSNFCTHSVTRFIERIHVLFQNLKRIHSIERKKNYIYLHVMMT